MRSEFGGASVGREDRGDGGAAEPVVAELRPAGADEVEEMKF